MTDAQLDEVMASTALVGDDELECLEIPHERVVDAVLAGEVNPSRSAVSSRTRRWRVLLPAAVAAGVLAFAAVQLVSTGSTARWAAAAVRVAESSPRLLVSESGWTVERVDEFSEDQGEMTFSDGESMLDLHWRTPVDEHWARVEDRAASADRLGTESIRGHVVELFRYPDGGDFTALWTEADRSVEARGDVPDLNAFRTLLSSLRPVDVETWLSALPASAVTPEDRDAAIDQMLRDIPTPPGFTEDQIPDDGGVSDRYQLGAAVTGTVACGWIQEWDDATQQGDTVAAGEAVDAMATAREWDVLQEMNAQGDWPEAIWKHADAMAGTAEVMTGRPMSVVASARHGLGCIQHW